MEIAMSKAHFERFVPHLPTDTRGKPRVDDRRVIGGIVHVLKSGCRWKDAPEAYGPHKTLYNRFILWASKGIWVGIFHALTDGHGRPVAFHLTGGQAADCRAAEDLLKQMSGCRIVHADKAYDTNTVRRAIQAHGALPNIPPKSG